MNTMEFSHIFYGFLLGLSLLSVVRIIFNSLTVQVDSETAVLLIRFGKLVQIRKESGLWFCPEKGLPWVKLVEVSLQRDFRQYQNIHINDFRGTTVIVDFWIEFSIVDPEKALFKVEDWEQSLKSLLTHSATSILCTQEFNKILCNRHELGIILRNDIQAETARWGLEIEMVMIQKVSLLPEVSRQMFATVAAKLERTKAHVEEEGRLRVALLEAETSSKVAELVAEAKGQYPEAIGRAYSQISKNPAVFNAYQELHDLTLLRPHKTVMFQGFSKGEIREVDAAMLHPSLFDAAIASRVSE